MRSTVIPDGYILLRDAFDRFGRVRFGTDWTGTELGPAEPPPKPSITISELDVERLEEAIVGYPDPAPRPDPRSDRGRRRDKAEDEFRQILYSGLLQAFLFRRYDATTIEIPNNYWLGDIFDVIIEYSYGGYFDRFKNKENYGIVLFHIAKLEDFLKHNSPFEASEIPPSLLPDAEKDETHQSPHSIPEPVTSQVTAGAIQTKRERGETEREKREDEWAEKIEPLRQQVGSYEGAAKLLQPEYPRYNASTIVRGAGRSRSRRRQVGKIGKISEE